MFGQHAPMLAPSGSNLWRIFILRGFTTAALMLLGAVAILLLELPLPLPPLLSVLGLLMLANLLTWWRLRQPWPEADMEFFAQLLVDVLAITALLYYAGGSTNPLVSYYLVPLVIAAITLPPFYTWSMATLTATCYTLLMFNYHPLMPRNGDFSTAVYLHLTGMWLTFVLSAFLIAFFVVRMANAVKQRDRALTAAREETLRNERIVALGTLAAGAAHELGTPLATMAVVTTELQQEHAGDPALVEDLRLLRQQVDNCKHILSGMLAAAGQGRAGEEEPQALDDYLADLLDKWQLLRPGVAMKAEWDGLLPAPRIIADQTLAQALLNLLNNAADASPESVEISGRWASGELQLEIRDRGPGLAPEVQQRAGQPFFTTKGHGFGIGLFLANATIERFGGRVILLNREGGGALTRVSLPLSKLQKGFT